MKSKINLIFLTLLVLISCSKKDEPNSVNESRKVNLIGNVEKGPFVRGSTLTIYELNDQFVPNGKSFKTEILDDKGSFSLKGLEISSKYVQITANGYYFDELTSELSKSTVSLNAIAEVENEKTINVNVLTHLEEKRLRKLINGGMSYANAKIQAQKELYSSFNVKDDVNILSAENVSFTQNNVNSTILFGISASILKMAESSEAKLTELLSVFSQDFEDDGALQENNLNKIKESFERLNAEFLNENIKSRFEKLGVEINDFKFLDVFKSGFKADSINVVIVEDNIFKEDFDVFYQGALSNHIKNIQQYFFIEGLYANTIDDASLKNNVFYKHQLVGYESDLKNIFSTIYNSIRNYNTIINKAEIYKESKNALISKDKSNILLAYSYWQLINFFGDPFYVNPENFEDFNLIVRLTRSNKNTVYTDLIRRVEGSITNLNGKDNKMADFGRLIAAKIYLELKEYSKANKLIEEIIGSNAYSLSTKSNALNEGKEIIFTNPINLESLQWIDSNFQKYVKKGNYLSFGRFTEVLLIGAELNVKLDNSTKALEYLNMVRLRNNKEKLSQNSSIINNIMLEYKEDLKNEGVYFSFLKRNDLAKETLNIEGFRQLFPIPQDQIYINPNATQNPGYN